MTNSAEAMISGPGTNSQTGDSWPSAPQAGELAGEAGVARRKVLCGFLAVGALGSAAGLLASCGSSSEDDSGPGSSTPSRALAGGSLAAVADIPVGGGKLVTAPDGTQIVLVRPSADDIKAYDAHCTHQQAIVNPPKGGRITCPRHGSQFDPANGNVLRDPARTPLKKIEVTVAGGQVKLA